MNDVSRLKLDRFCIFEELRENGSLANGFFANFFEFCKNILL